MSRKRVRTAAIVSVLCIGSFGALAMLPADPETIARAGIAGVSSQQAETLASIDAMLGPKDEVVAALDDRPAPIDRAAIAPAAAEPDWANLQTAALTEPVPEPPPIAATDAIGSAAVNLRSGPSSSSSTLSVLQPGQPIQISGEQDGWIEVTLPDGTTGWVYARYVAGKEPPKSAAATPAPEAREAKAVVNNANGKLKGRTARIDAALAVRAKPSAGARTVFRTTPGERVRIIGSDGDWLQIRTISGDLGWIRYAG
ncbi:MAG: hypothetical protein EOP22_11165 [Hyphomicrobiales bacterium]|nr:MAG: hypothetical protein EOP22_11165 [Hyphomicrobiales bacterium]